MNIQCTFCGRTRNQMPCMNTRDLEDANNRVCYGALLVAGGGEYTVNRLLSQDLAASGRLPSAEEYHHQVAAEDNAYMDRAWELREAL